ncbi:unnamed protein product [Candidula unifasciata]|uniref:Uncharacterized protein n=1 Tax=Candidula unifasciata TaxID=100452 RepID=A0A8S3Z6Q7_9EUPU|nr:unnamed protein product [Candidula unifasciata]
MARLQELLSNLLCHEAISFLIYGTAFLLLLVYIPYWIRQQLDRHYLKFLAKKARERHLKQMEYTETSPDVNYLDSGFTKEDDDEDDYGYEGDDQKERKEGENANAFQKNSDEKLSYMSPVSSRIAH